jgi:hypothetical protein
MEDKSIKELLNELEEETTEETEKELSNNKRDD